MASEYPDVVFAKVNIQKAKVRNYKQGHPTRI